MIGIAFEPLQQLFEADSSVPKDLIKQHVADHFKIGNLTGVPEHNLSVEFEDTEGSDILIRKVDLKNALGYNTFSSESEYFNDLNKKLYEPSQQEIMEASLSG